MEDKCEFKDCENFNILFKIRERYNSKGDYDPKGKIVDIVSSYPVICIQCVNLKRNSFNYRTKDEEK